MNDQFEYMTIHSTITKWYINTGSEEKVIKKPKRNTKHKINLNMEIAMINEYAQQGWRIISTNYDALNTIQSIYLERKQRED